MLKHWLLTATFALGFAQTGCMTPPTAADRLTDAAYEMNLAARFGRMDVALAYVDAQARKGFAKGHTGWGRNLRIVDLEFAGLDMISKEEATVLVHVSWQRVDESILRTTSIQQRWSDKEEGGWRVVAEKRVGGEPGLLNEPPGESTTPIPLGAKSVGAETSAAEANSKTDAEPTPDLRIEVQTPVGPSKVDRARFSTVVIPGDVEAMD